MKHQTLAAHVETAITPKPDAADGAGGGTAFAMLLTLSFCHLLNDMVQSLVPAMYPILKENHALSFGQVGLITLAFQCTASLLQPVVGFCTDKRPAPYSLTAGMASTLIGLLLLSQAASYPVILLAAALIGVGSSVFHPEASRVARLASGGRYGLAQSLFQVGGNSGQSIGPLLAAFVVAPRGQHSIAWFSAAALLAMAMLARVGGWYARNRQAINPKRPADTDLAPMPRSKVLFAVAVLVALIFSKNVYTASLNSYYTFYLIETFSISVQAAQVYLFIYLASIVAGLVLGGAVSDRVGRLPVIWFSILGVLPFTLALPHVGLAATVVLTAIIGLVMSSAFPAILVYAQQLMPGRVGLVAGIFFGFSFGLGGLGAAALGELADHVGIRSVYAACAWLPIIGVLTALLPNIEKKAA
jgi:FSR family fosmidomycin resistance protein-like MFS transporter